MHTVIYVLCTMLYMTFILNTIIKKILYIVGKYFPLFYFCCFHLYCQQANLRLSQWLKLSLLKHNFKIGRYHFQEKKGEKITLYIVAIFMKIGFAFEHLYSILYDEVFILKTHLSNKRKKKDLHTVQTLGVNGWFPLNFLLCLVVCPPSSLFVPSVTDL